MTCFEKFHGNAWSFKFARSSHLKWKCFTYSFKVGLILTKTKWLSMWVMSKNKLIPLLILQCNNSKNVSTQRISHQLWNFVNKLRRSVYQLDPSFRFIYNLLSQRQMSGPALVVLVESNFPSFVLNYEWFQWVTNLIKCSLNIFINIGSTGQYRTVGNDFRSWWAFWMMDFGWTTLTLCWFQKKIWETHQFDEAWARVQLETIYGPVAFLKGGRRSPNALNTMICLFMANISRHHSSVIVLSALADRKDKQTRAQMHSHSSFWLLQKEGSSRSTLCLSVNVPCHAGLAGKARLMSAVSTPCLVDVMRVLHWQNFAQSNRIQTFDS